MVERHGGILKVGTLAKDQFPHAREVRTREGAFLKVFSIERISSCLSSKKALEALEL